MHFFGDGEALGFGVEEESSKLAPSDLLTTTSTIAAAVDKSRKCEDRRQKMHKAMHNAQSNTKMQKEAHTCWIRRSHNSHAATLASTIQIHPQCPLVIANHNKTKKPYLTCIEEPLIPINNAKLQGTVYQIWRSEARGLAMATGQTRAG